MTKRPSRLGAMWSALVIGAAPIRLWAQILGFGTVILSITHTLHKFFVTIDSPAGPVEIKLILAKGAVWIAMALCFIALAEVVAITELKVGFNASKDGVHADLERDNDEPLEAKVEGDIKITPKPEGGAS